ncbi:MAG: hypothetical protein HYZ14_15425 [Bacteroidetes bacterium]|nr:hypothetical protein [Bacteroidota bacterium]
MKLKYYFLPYLITTFFGCRKDPKIDPISPPDPCAITGYSSYSTESFDHEEKQLVTTSMIGPFNFNLYTDGHSQGNPVVNPNNPYEIAYSYRDTSITGITSEIWTFNFCTGKRTKVADNYYYNLDWGVNDWLLFTGTGNKVFKVKSNGDSLTKITDLSGYNNAGKWSPDGTKFFFTGDNGLVICDQKGNVIEINASLNYFAIDWINNETLLCPYYGTTYKFHSFNYVTNSIDIINTNWACSTCGYIYDRSHNIVYGTVNLGTGNDDFFLKYDLTLNTIDTVRTLYDTYQYSTGSYIEQTDKVLTAVSRKNWKDSANNEVYVRIDLLLMDSDCSNEKLILIPN